MLDHLHIFFHYCLSFVDWLAFQCMIVVLHSISLKYKLYKIGFIYNKNNTNRRVKSSVLSSLIIRDKNSLPMLQVDFQTSMSFATINVSSID